MMEKYDTRVNAYIDKSADFAKPILIHIRQTVHEASPLITETIKWGFPFFDYKGPVCQMAAFKKHCAFGFWKASRLYDPLHLLNRGEEAAAGSFGRINDIADLPDEKILKEFVRQAITLNEKREKLAARKPVIEKTVLTTPEYLTEALLKNPKALYIFEAFSASQKKEYITWLIEAKTDATRHKRLQTAIEWISEGKIRNWKYK